MKQNIGFLLGGLLSMSALANCPPQTKTIFKCTTTNHKILQVCDAGKTIQYSLAKIGQPAEINLNVDRHKVKTFQWQGRSDPNYTVIIPNKNTTYTVFSGVDRLNQQAQSGVSVEINQRLVAQVMCLNTNDRIDRIEGVRLASVDEN